MMFLGAAVSASRRARKLRLMAGPRFGVEIETLTRFLISRPICSQTKDFPPSFKLANFFNLVFSPPLKITLARKKVDKGLSQTFLRYISDRSRMIDGVTLVTRIERSHRIFRGTSKYLLSSLAFAIIRGGYLNKYKSVDDLPCSRGLWLNHSLHSKKRERPVRLLRGPLWCHPMQLMIKEHD
jgi:hypothetical protein